MKTQAEARKRKKATSTIEHVHALRLLQNHYLQWRYANAKIEATMNVQSHIFEMPYLDEWSTFECEYSSSLSGAIKALQDASVQLPIMNLLVSIRNKSGFPIEIGEKLGSASIVLVSEISLVLFLLKESLMFLRFCFPFVEGIAVIQDSIFV
ncbi:hypothetical protein Scep_003766 [Stephania cephalantha]|uniref:Uncharacterized protein n=1 Tax=Stephania cephalantha TaxID=152367 RepID=A0AAP0PUQ2_9MAGN